MSRKESDESTDSYTKALLAYNKELSENVLSEKPVKLGSVQKDNDVSENSEVMVKSENLEHQHKSSDDSADSLADLFEAARKEIEHQRKSEDVVSEVSLKSVSVQEDSHISEISEMIVKSENLKSQHKSEDVDSEVSLKPVLVKEDSHVSEVSELTVKSENLGNPSKSEEVVSEVSLKPVSVQEDSHISEVSELTVKSENLGNPNKSEEVHSGISVNSDSVENSKVAKPDASHQAAIIIGNIVLGALTLGLVHAVYYALCGIIRSLAKGMALEDWPDKDPISFVFFSNNSHDTGGNYSVLEDLEDISCTS